MLLHACCTGEHLIKKFDLTCGFSDLMAVVYTNKHEVFHLGQGLCVVMP